MADLESKVWTIVGIGIAAGVAIPVCIYFAPKPVAPPPVTTTVVQPVQVPVQVIERPTQPARKTIRIEASTPEEFQQQIDAAKKKLEREAASQ
jgi:hypothetical protein